MKKNQNDLTIKNLPLSERPYEILERRGAEALTDAQLVAIILKNGTPGESSVTLSTRILGELNCFGQDPLIALAQLPIASLKEFHGIGRVKAIEIQAVMEIAKRLSQRMIAKRNKNDNPWAFPRQRPGAGCRWIALYNLSISANSNAPARSGSSGTRDTNWGRTGCPCPPA